MSTEPENKKIPSHKKLSNKHGNKSLIFELKVGKQTSTLTPFKSNFRISSNNLNLEHHRFKSNHNKDKIKKQKKHKIKINPNKPNKSTLDWP